MTGIVTTRDLPAPYALQFVTFKNEGRASDYARPFLCSGTKTLCKSEPSECEQEEGEQKERRSAFAAILSDTGVIQFEKVGDHQTQATIPYTWQRQRQRDEERRRMAPDGFLA